MGKIGLSVIATTGYNDEILSSPDRRYKRFLLYFKDTAWWGDSGNFLCIEILGI